MHALITARQITARQAAKNDARARVYRRFYAIFDHLESECRAATRDSDSGWDAYQLRQCKARACEHLEKTSTPPLQSTCAHV